MICFKIRGIKGDIKIRIQVLKVNGVTVVLKFNLVYILQN